MYYAMQFRWGTDDIGTYRLVHEQQKYNLDAGSKLTLHYIVHEYDYKNPDIFRAWDLNQSNPPHPARQS